MHKHEHKLEQIHLQMIDDGKIDMHRDRVAEVSYNFALDLGVPDHFAKVLRSAARYHDIGKLAIPNHILSSTQRLTPEEFEIIKSHAVAGYEMSSEFFDDLTALTHDVWHTKDDAQHEQEFLDILFAHLVRVVCLNHHEFWDGNGYPNHLSGNAIPIPARIVAPCDMFDAILSRRAYKDAFTPSQVYDIMEQDLGKKLDPHYGQIFLDNFDKFVEIHNTLPK